MDLLQYDDVKVRAMKLLSMLNMQLELTKIKQDINQKVKSEMDQQQREYYLNSQLRTIQEELGMDDGDDIEALKARAEKMQTLEQDLMAKIAEKQAAETAKIQLTPAEMLKLEVLAESAGIDTRGSWEHTME